MAQLRAEAESGELWSDDDSVEDSEFVELGNEQDLLAFDDFEKDLMGDFEQVILSTEKRTNPHHDAGDALESIAKTWTKLNPPLKRRGRRTRRAQHRSSPPRALRVLLHEREGNRRRNVEGDSAGVSNAGSLIIFSVKKQDNGDPIFALLWNFDKSKADEFGASLSLSEGSSVLPLALRRSTLDFIRRQLEYNGAKLTDECSAAMIAKEPEPKQGGGWRASFLTTWNTDPCSESGCYHCGRIDEVFRNHSKDCSACRRVSYCNVTCQKASWKKHKAECKRWALCPAY